ncbi:MAG: bifunctional oligoribonuclease/PAP phosphatase NrnA [Promethearchaeota archaeon]
MLEPFLEFFQLFTPQKILITSHENADPDALCSAFALESLIQTLYPGIKTMISFDGINMACQNIVKKLNLQIKSSDELTSDAIILVDTNSTNQLGILKDQINWEKPVLIIDHHVLHSNTKNITNFLIINTNAIATSELIFNIYQALNVSPSLKDSFLILLGIISDSRHLILANNKTLQIIHQLIEYGVNYSEIIETLLLPLDRPERIARLKAAQRLTIHEFNGWIVAISHVSAFEASACRALINLGADVALVFGQKKDEIRVSARATNAIVNKTNLNLAKDIMEKIGPIMHGEGGGHDRAAGCNGKDNLERGMELAVQLLKKKLTNQS